MGNLLVWFMIVGLAFAVVNVWILRRVFRINDIVHTLESIDESLSHLPAVREARLAEARGRAA